MIEEAIINLSKSENLKYELAKNSMNEIMEGKATNIQISSYLTALSIKGETITEITASAEAMRSHSTKFENTKDVLEIVGTGGDGSNSFNISTTSSFVISATGIPVAKHGNRAASSKSGAADVLESLGVNINTTPEQSKKILDKINLCFLFAQKYHSAMKYVAPVRKELGIRTIFNILGPLANPANANMQIMGVYSEELVKPLAKVLNNLGVKRGLVVYGMDKLDEISVSSKTLACEIKDNTIEEYIINPKDYGFTKSEKKDLLGGDSKTNAQITKNILNGEKGPKRDAVLINSAAALYIADKVNTLNEGVDLAKETIDSGAAMEQLNSFIELSNKIQ